MLSRWYTDFPFEPWQVLLKELNRNFEERPLSRRAHAGQAYPPVNIWTTENDAVLEAELPGVDPGNIEINVLQDVVSLRGQRQPGEAEKEINYRRQERVVEPFHRSFKLPFRVDSNKVEAKYDKGVLRIQLPRSEQDKPKQIKVKGS